MSWKGIYLVRRRPRQETSRFSRRRLLTGAAVLGGATATSMALAENFTLFDSYHCSVLGPTTPNRMMWMTGTIDPNGDGGGPLLETVTSGNFNWPTYAEALTEAGVSWKFYNDAPGNAYMNVLPYFQNFQKSDPGSVLYDGGVAPAATGQFEYDCLTGNLPAVTWLGAPEQYWEHPSDTPAYGGLFDLTGAFAGPRYNPALPDLPDTNGQVWLANYTTTLPLPGIPTTNQTFPVQPPGVRRPRTR
jgi:hypothetical protein